MKNRMFIIYALMACALAQPAMAMQASYAQKAKDGAQSALKWSWDNLGKPGLKGTAALAASLGVPAVTGAFTGLLTNALLAQKTGTNAFGVGVGAVVSGWLFLNYGYLIGDATYAIINKEKPSDRYKKELESVLTIQKGTEEMLEDLKIGLAEPKNKLMQVTASNAYIANKHHNRKVDSDALVGGIDSLVTKIQKSVDTVRLNRENVAKRHAIVVHPQGMTLNAIRDSQYRAHNPQAHLGYSPLNSFYFSKNKPLTGGIITEPCAGALFDAASEFVAVVENCTKNVEISAQNNAVVQADKAVRNGEIIYIYCTTALSELTWHAKRLSWMIYVSEKFGW